MADAGANRAARDLREGISRTDAERRHTVRARRGDPGLVLLRLYPSLGGRVRNIFRPLRTGRPARSHDYPDSAEAGLFFPLDLFDFVSASARDGDSRAADQASRSEEHTSELQSLRH